MNGAGAKHGTITWSNVSRVTGNSACPRGIAMSRDAAASFATDNAADLAEDEGMAKRCYAEFGSRASVGIDSKL